MSERDDFLAWVGSDLYAAELAIHNGDADPRRALWSREEPVSVLGAWRNAFGLREVDELFTHLAESFSACTSYAFELRACRCPRSAVSASASPAEARALRCGDGAALSSTRPCSASTRPPGLPCSPPHAVT
ncbi:hypothetical protein [Streptomyces sp. NPDC005476]|uniref:hypothetical protein n=1 Tax=Streptomyces sp. NPDC005476 TaxID=3156882 RepID=UPI003451CD17